MKFLLGCIMAAGLLPITQAEAADFPPIQTVRNVTVKHFYGYARDLRSGRYLYTEVHEERFAPPHKLLSAVVDYYAPDGHRLAQETYNYSGDPYLPVYTLNDYDPVYAQGISKVTSTRVTMFKKESAKDATKYKTVARQQDMVADAALTQYLVGHFSALDRHQALTPVVVAPGRLNTYRFRVKRIKDVEVAGQTAVNFKLNLNSLLSWFASPVYGIYGAKSHRLLEYRGVSNILDPTTGKVFKDVRVTYTSSPPANAPSKLPPLG